MSRPPLPRRLPRRIEASASVRDRSIQAAEQPIVDIVEMSSGQREMPVVVGELSFDPGDVAREPLPVAKGNEPVLASME
jgi:hypothetical protein